METKQVTLPVTGMTCANCSLTIERNLRRLSGVEEASVNLATERATVIYDPSLVRQDDFLALIRDIGYDVAIARAELPITGMTCANCATTIERVLRRLEGVVSAHVNLANERASVEYLPGVVSLAAIQQAIRDVGYDVVVAGEGEAAEDVERAAREAEIQDQTRRFWVGAAFTLPLFFLSMARDFGAGHAGSVLCRLGLLRGRLQEPAGRVGEYGCSGGYGLFGRLLLQCGRLAISRHR